MRRLEAAFPYYVLNIRLNEVYVYRWPHLLIRVIVLIYSHYIVTFLTPEFGFVNTWSQLSHPIEATIIKLSEFKVGKTLSHCCFFCFQQRGIAFIPLCSQFSFGYAYSSILCTTCSGYVSITFKGDFLTTHKFLFKGFSFSLESGIISQLSLGNADWRVWASSLHGISFAGF